MRESSLWLETPRQEYPFLRGRLGADVTVVGGGLAGVQTAYLLAKEGLKVILVEADRLGRGASGHTTAKVTAQHGTKYSALIKTWGREVAGAYASTQQAAVRRMGALAASLKIGCQWEEQSASLIALKREERQTLEREHAAQQAAGLPSGLYDHSSCPIPVLGELRLAGQAMFQPVEYLLGVARAFQKLGGQIYEKSPVENIDGEIVYTNAASVRSPYIVLCTHYPILNKTGGLFLKLTQRRSHVTALENGPDFQGMYLSVREGGVSLRRYREAVLLGGWDYRCGSQTRVPHAELLEQTAAHFFPGAEPVMAWHAQDVFTMDSLPYAGPVSAKHPRILFATGFAKWGMTNSYVAAWTICARILGRSLDQLSIYDPQRSIRKSIFPMAAMNAVTAWEMAAGLARLSQPTCPHMGCKLKYVPDTKSWDCPCHGSRFDPIGRIENTPAVVPAHVSLKQRP